MKLGYIKHLVLPKGLDDLSSLCVPQLDHLVITRAEEALAIIAEVDVLHTLPKEKQMCLQSAANGFCAD